MLTCPVCSREFDPGDRTGPTTLDGSLVQVVYCSETCTRKAENRRYYAAHKDEIKTRVIANQRGTRNKTPRRGDDDLSLD